jgi:hypothetical protein
MEGLTYLHLTPGDALPALNNNGCFKAVVVVEDDVTPKWRAAVSDWLVRSGCRYMMAWGRECSKWDDSVDCANLSLFDYGEIPEAEFVMTTWHEQDSLGDVFRISAHAAGHPSLELHQTFIIHVAPHERSAALLQALREAQDA